MYMSTTSTPVTAGWNDITIASTAVTSGTYYWLAFISDGKIIDSTGTGAIFRYKAYDYSTFLDFPADLTGSGLQGAGISSGIYAIIAGYSS